MRKPSDRLATRSALIVPEVQSRKDQYDLLRPYYVEETERYEALNKRAAAYLSVVGAVSVFAAFRIEFISRSILATPWLVAMAVAALVSLLLCVLAVAHSMRIREYKSPIDPKALVLAADERKFNSNDTYSVLLAGLVDATEWNRAQNDKRANALELALWCAAVAVALAVATNVALVYLTQQEPKMATSSEKSSGAPVPAPAPTASQPGKTPMADLLNTTQTVPLKKGGDLPIQRQLDDPPSHRYK